jgi:Plasmid replication region DNA-binding N-term
MTLEDVQMAKVALEAEGIQPSYNAVLARLGHGSKRDVAKLMQLLAASDAPVPSLADALESPLGAVPVPALAALGAELPLPEPPGPPFPPPPEPPLPPEPPFPPEPPLPPAEASPLSRARQERDQTAAQELALGQEEQALKQARKRLEDAVQQLAIRALGQASDAQDLERRRQVREIERQFRQAEEARVAVHRQRREAAVAKLTAADQYNGLADQARRWLRRLREAERQARTLPHAWARGDAAAEAHEAQQSLAALIGIEDAQRCATDTQYQPAWLKD